MGRTPECSGYTDVQELLEPVGTTLPLLSLSGDDPSNSATHNVVGRTPEVIMAWVLLFVAGLFEIGWAIGLKYTYGFTRLWPSVGTISAMIVSVALLSWAMRSLPVGTAYAVWTGIGAVGTVLLGIVLFGDSMTPSRLACVALIVTGILGLKLTS